MKTLFTDNQRAGSEIRTENINILKSFGFTESGLPSHSGELVLVQKMTKTTLIFGVRSNIGGKKFNKYFSISKDFKSTHEAETFYNSIKLFN